MKEKGASLTDKRGAFTLIERYPAKAGGGVVRGRF
jgi:hypothetical protein